MDLENPYLVALMITKPRRCTQFLTSGYESRVGILINIKKAFQYNWVRLEHKHHLQYNRTRHKFSLLLCVGLNVLKPILCSIHRRFFPLWKSNRSGRAQSGSWSYFFRTHTISRSCTQYLVYDEGFVTIYSNGVIGWYVQLVFHGTETCSRRKQISRLLITQRKILLCTSIYTNFHVFITYTGFTFCMLPSFQRFIAVFALSWRKPNTATKTLSAEIPTGWC